MAVGKKLPPGEEYIPHGILQQVTCQYGPTTIEIGT